MKIHNLIIKVHILHYHQNLHIFLFFIVLIIPFHILNHFFLCFIETFHHHFINTLEFIKDQNHLFHFINHFNNCIFHVYNSIIHFYLNKFKINFNLYNLILFSYFYLTEFIVIKLHSYFNEYTCNLFQILSNLKIHL